MAKMERAEAERVFGLSGKYDAAVLREKRRELVKKYHPDLAAQNGISKEEAEAKTIELQAAYSTLDVLVRMRGEVTAIGSQPSPSGSAQNSTPSGTATPSETPTWTYTPTASTWQPSTDSSPSTDNSASEPASDPLVYREPFLRKVIEHFPYRIGFIVLSFVITYLLTGGTILDDDWRSDAPELFFLLFGMTMASFLNLIIGTVTIPAKQACLWFYDKFIGKTEFPESKRHAIFGHLPYRILLLLLTIWWYWDYATFHVADGGALDWPIRVLAFLAAGLNFIYPFITEPIRDILAGDDF